MHQKALLCRGGHEGWRKRGTERIYGMMQNCGVRLCQQFCYEMPTVDLFRARVWQPSVATCGPQASSYQKKTISHVPTLVTHGSLCTRDRRERTEMIHGYTQSEELRCAQGIIPGNVISCCWADGHYSLSIGS